MTLYRSVLFKVKQDATKENVDELCRLARAMKGQIPGLLELEIGSGLLQTAEKAKGYTLGLFARMEGANVLPVYAVHPSHKATFALRDLVCEGEPRNSPPLANHTNNINLLARFCGL
ncbi:hypothetical protein CBS101457_005041 [Exobasidium rhododendri]|nr:hypothetical protein CBS101457_005041 [Exobasidium rhododendri]